MTVQIIQTSQRRRTHYLIRNFCISLLVIFIALFRIKFIQTQLEKSLNEEFGLFYFIFLISTVILIFYFHFLSRRMKKIGRLEMSIDELIIQLKNKTLSFNIRQLSNFKIQRKYTDIKKETVSLISSYDNWLIFDMLNVTYNFQFKIESDFKNRQLTDLMNNWKENSSFNLIEEK